MDYQTTVSAIVVAKQYSNPEASVSQYCFLIHIAGVGVLLEAQLTKTFGVGEIKSFRARVESKSQQLKTQLKSLHGPSG